MGSRQLTAHAEKVLAVKLHGTSENNAYSLEPIYCLGNCACSPAVMIGEKVYGKVDTKKFNQIVGFKE